MTEDTHDAFKVSVTGPKGEGAPFTVAADRLVIGSGSHCEVQLPVEQAAPEQIELTIVNGRVFAAALAFDPAPTIDGSPFVRSFLVEGATLGVGAHRIAVTAVAGGHTAKKKNAPPGLRPVLLGMGLLTSVLLLIGTWKEPTGGERGLGVAPLLWTSAAATCPQTAAGPALALATVKRSLAEGKRERRAFHVEDGVAAVRLFDTATACFAVGGDERSSDEAREAATTLRAKIDEEYHAHQVVLEHSLKTGDSVTTAHEVKLLVGLTEGLGGPYVARLSDLQRQLQM